MKIKKLITTILLSTATTLAGAYNAQESSPVSGKTVLDITWDSAYSLKTGLAEPSLASAPISPPPEPGDLTFWENYFAGKGLTSFDPTNNVYFYNKDLSDFPNGEYWPVSDAGSIFLYGDQIPDISAFKSLQNVGSLFLYGNQLTNVDGLSNLNSVGWHFYLYNNQLTNVDGLSNLNSVGGALYLTSNQLTNVDGLSNLTSVGGNFSLTSNQLTNVDGLSNLKSVGGYLHLNNNQLTNVDGLSNLTSVGGHLYLHDNQLTNVDVLSNLTSVGNLNLSNNQLTNVDGLSNLTSVREELSLQNNQLTNVNGLSSLTSGGSSLYLINNPITDISGLANITSLRYSYSRIRFDYIRADGTVLVTQKMPASAWLCQPAQYRRIYVNMSPVGSFRHYSYRQTAACDCPDTNADNFCD